MGVFPSKQAKQQRAERAAATSAVSKQEPVAAVEKENVASRTSKPGQPSVSGTTTAPTVPTTALPEKARGDPGAQLEGTTPPAPPPPPSSQQYMSSGATTTGTSATTAPWTADTGTSQQLVEHGLIRFYYRPGLVSTSEPAHNTSLNSEEVPRLYIMLVPGVTDASNMDDQSRHGKKRLLVVGQKAVAGSGIGSNLTKTACFVATVTEDMEDIRKVLIPVTAGPSPKPCGEGCYAIANISGLTHLVYMIRPATECIAELRDEFNLQKEGSYVLAVKNPQYPSSSSNVKLPKSRFPRELQDHFAGDRRWAPLCNPAFLEYVGAELVLLGVSARHDEEDLGEAGAELRCAAREGAVKDVGKLMQEYGKPLPNSNPIA